MIVASPPDISWMLFDGDCGFCRFWVERWKIVLGDRIVFRPYQDVVDRFPEIPVGEFRKAVHLVEPSGAVSRSAEAVFRARAIAGKSLLQNLYRHLPGFRGATELAYRLIAEHRGAADTATRLIWGRDPRPPTWARSTWLFLRILGAISFIAFLSLWVQIDGLAGSGGILPAGRFLDAVSSRFGMEKLWLAPTLCWISASNGFLHFLCLAGAVVSGLLMFDVAPAACALFLWADYLSLSIVAQEFLSFQWDILLLESLFIAIFLSPLRILPPKSPPAEPPAVARWMSRWLLFRLMFFSGVVKLASGDPHWRNLSALRFHYETQPLPTWIGWFAHQLPPKAQTLSTLLMFAVELGASCLIFAPRRLRHFGLVLLIGLQVAIGLTGNYAFFNLLAIALCLLAWDDQSLPGRREEPRVPRIRWPRWILIAVAAVVVTVSGVEIEEVLFRGAWPAPAVAVAELAGPFRTINSYGLFAVMTTTRPEIIVEGSDDDANWKAYEFRWKPGDLSRRPAFVEPHQPRLDWQMWFAALGSLDQNPWMEAFLGRLIDGSPDVLRLLRTNPFPDRPPRYVRAREYDYKFTTFDEKRRTGNWWKRTVTGDYSPVFSKPGPVALLR